MLYSELQCSEAIHKAVERMGFAHVEPRVSDGTKPDADLPMADAILVDAPCSGLGILAKKPDIRYKTLEKTRHDELLGHPVGHSGYSRRPPERGRASGLLHLHHRPCRERRAGAGLRGPTPGVPGGDAGRPLPGRDDRGGLGCASVPTRTGMDGFFLCAMQKRDS